MGGWDRAPGYGGPPPTRWLLPLWVSLLGTITLGAIFWATIV